MRFPSRILSSVTQTSRAHQEHRSTGRRRSPIAVERLENRNLLSIAGVSLQFGNLAIAAPNSSHNTAVVSIDTTNHNNVKVTLNGASEEFSPSLVASITYKGGSGGNDTFTDSTNLMSLAYGYGGNNNFTGGGSYNYVYFFGNNNTFSDTVVGSVSDVFENGGTGDTINDPPGVIIQVYH
jgi:hypothetical protein